MLPNDSLEPTWPARFEWLRNDAGPLLFLPKSLLPEWSGIDVPDFRTVEASFRWNADETRASDYDRACDVDDYVATIPVGHGEGLVLNEQPYDTAWLPHPHGGRFARWVYAENERGMAEALLRAPERLPWADKGRMRLTDSEQVLFNSAEPGLDELLPRLTIALPSGVYAIRRAEYRPDAITAVDLVDLTRVD